MRTREALAVAALAAALVGCGGGAGAQKTVDPNGAEVSPPGDIPDNQAFVRFHPRGADYSVEVPEGWARRNAGRAVSFADKLNSVAMQEASRAVATSERSARAAYPKGEVSTVARKGDKAVRIVSQERSRPDPVTGKARMNAVERYVFSRSGKEVTLTLSGPRGADNVDPWRIVTDSFRWQ
jgi:hypothetical protein